MKHFAIFLCCLVASGTEGLVNNTKVSEPDTTQGTTETTSGADGTKVIRHKTVTKVESVYLEDVFYNLKNQKWKDGQEACRNQTLLMLTALKNFSLWAVWQWDSIASEPMGLLYGNTMNLGNFDECLNAPWRETHPELDTQYCLADIVLSNNKTRNKKLNSGIADPYSSTLNYFQRTSFYGGSMNELTWGVCVPVSCDRSSVEKLMSVLLARSHLGTTGIQPQISVKLDCQKTIQNTNYDGLFYSFVIFTGVMFLMCLASTIVTSCSILKPSLKLELINAFSLKKNGNELLKVNVNGNEVLYGIRAISMWFIVLDHLFGMRNICPISDSVEFDKRAQTILGMFLLHNDLFVDSYFFISAFLLMSGLLKCKGHINPFMLILKRYIRLGVAFALVIYFTVSVFPYIGSGPLWPLIIRAEKDPCLKTWWLSLLMVGNYVDTDNMCHIISWYIPCDFHYFVVTVLLFCLYKRQWRVPAAMVAAILAVCALVMPAIVNYIYDLPPIQVFDRAFLLNPRSSFQYIKAYIPSHTRASSYVVGLVVGAFCSTYGKNEANRLNKVKASIGACAGLAMMMAVMMTGHNFISSDFHPVQGAVYACLQRPVWAFGLGLLIVCCTMGEVPIIKSTLSWYPLVPLSRLAYGLYLTHGLLVVRVVGVTRNPINTDVTALMDQVAGLIVMGSLTALFIWMFFEAPINNLLGVLLKPTITRALEKAGHTENVKDVNVISVNVETKTSRLQDNLCNTVNISSKI